MDGMRDNKLGYKCERRATYIVDGHECAQAFLHCCHDVEARSMEGWRARDDSGSKYAS